MKGVDPPTPAARMTGAEQKLAVIQAVYSLAAKGIRLDPEQLAQVLVDIRPRPGRDGVELIDIDLRVNVRSADKLKEAAAQIRQLAMQLEQSAQALP